MIMWRVMTSLEYKQPVTVRKCFVEFKKKDYATNISFLFRGVIPISLAMGL